MAENPYAAPKTHVADAPTQLPDGEFIAEGRGVPGGNGWAWIADAWAFMGEQRWTFIGLFLLWLLIQIVAQFIPIIGPLASAILSPVLIGGFILGCDAVRRGERLEVGHLFAGFQRHTSKLAILGALSIAFGIVAAILMFVIIGGSFMPILMSGGEPSPEDAVAMIGPLLLGACVVLALSIPITMAMLFATPLIVLADFEVGAALKTSFFACLKNIVPFLVWSIAAFVLAIIAAIPFFLGYLLLGPVMMVSLYMSYRDIFHEV